MSTGFIIIAIVSVVVFLVSVVVGITRYDEIQDAKATIFTKFVCPLFLILSLYVMWDQFSFYANSKKAIHTIDEIKKFRVIPFLLFLWVCFIKVWSGDLEKNDIKLQRLFRAGIVK